MGSPNDLPSFCQAVCGYDGDLCKLLSRDISARPAILMTASRSLFKELASLLRVSEWEDFTERQKINMTWPTFWGIALSSCNRPT
jgi:hypothetical protein